MGWALEKLLTDRSKEEVRESAAYVCLRSAAACLASALPPGCGHAGSGSKDEWQIEPARRAVWERDGDLAAAAATISRREAWWLQQMVELAPLDFWIGRDARATVGWSRRGDWKTWRCARGGWRLARSAGCALD